MERQGDEVHLNTEEASGGKTGMGVRYVLMLTLALVIVAFAALWLMQSGAPGQSGQAPAPGVAPEVSAT
ncbi:MAG: hypothetical protein ACKOQM_08270 [Novosphingobium sp.]